MEKLKRVAVNTPKGVRYLTFKPVDATPDVMICEKFCSYHSVCDKIKDPRHLDRDDKVFTDFCGSMGDESLEKEEIDNIEALPNLIPVDGTIEEALGDIIDIHREVIDKNPLVRLNSVIDSVCSGWCDSYSPDHCNCKSTNQLCILKDLFLKSKQQNTENEGEN